MLDQVAPSPSEQLITSWVAADLSARDWEAALPGAPFDLVVAFAVLHHLPGDRLRQQILQAVRHVLKPDGRFIHSNWQFLNSPRLRARIQPWETIGLRAEDVDPGDYLVDWRQGGSGLRYVHHFTAQELESLAHACGYRVMQTFLSDGEAGSLGLYQIWQPT
jgi:SAM-dependent methyltransferase